jgi:beta-glucosidase-like glycosyl hydrolase
LHYRYNEAKSEGFAAQNTHFENSKSPEPFSTASRTSLSPLDMRLLSGLPTAKLALSLCLVSIFLPPTTAFPYPTQDPSIYAGQHVMYSYSGLTPPNHLIDLTRSGKVGGIILFKANIGNHTADTISQLHSAYHQSPYYLGVPLILTDQEGGLVRRVPGSPLLSAKKVGNSSNPIKTAIEAGHEVVKALEPYNVNTNLAPVLDIYRQEGDFIDQFQRSYGNTSRIVSECATSFLVPEQALRIVSTAKHSPGLGSAPRGVNTDLEAVTIATSLSGVRAVDEVPYIAPIAAGIKMVMTSWAIYPSLDAEKPAGLSSQ